MKKLLSFLFFCGPLFFFSCDRTESLPPTSATALLTKSAWTTFDDLVETNGVFVSDIEDCDKDNIWLFKADGSLTVQEGPMRCSPPVPNVSLNWSLQKDDTVLRIIFGDPDDPEYKIVTLTEHKLELLATEVPSPANAGKEKLILTR